MWIIMQKRGQLTLFIILGIVLVSFLFYVSTLKSNNEITKTQILDTKPIKLFVENCLISKTSEAIPIVGFAFLNLTEDYLNDNLKDCIKNFSAFPEIKIEEGNISSDIIIPNDNRSLIVNLNYPLSIYKGPSKSEISDFRIVFPLSDELNIPTTTASYPLMSLFSSGQRPELTIHDSTNAIDNTSNPLSSITVTLEDIIMQGLYNETALSLLSYNFEPDGANFDPPLRVTIPYDESLIPLGYDEEDLKLSYWNDGFWNSWPTEVDTENNILIANVTHFTKSTPTSWTENQVSRGGRMNANIPYNSDWVIEAEGTFRRSSHSRIITSGPEFGLDWLIYQSRSSLIMRLSNRKINFNGASVGSLTTSAPPDHFASSGSVSLESGRHTLRVEYSYSRRRMRVYIDNRKVGDFTFSVLSLPSRISYLKTPGFSGKLRYYVGEINMSGAGGSPSIPSSNLINLYDSKITVSPDDGLNQQIDISCNQEIVIVPELRMWGNYHGQCGSASFIVKKQNNSGNTETVFEWTRPNHVTCTGATFLGQSYSNVCGGGSPIPGQEFRLPVQANETIHAIGQGCIRNNPQGILNPKMEFYYNTTCNS